jgi:hypothetical protein
LGDGRYDFKGSKYDQLRELFDPILLSAAEADSEDYENELDAKFAHIGLATEQDLIDKGIVPPKNQPVNQQIILDNLYNYIRKHSNERDLKRVSHGFSEPKNSSWFPAYETQQKVCRVLYRYLRKGFISIPLFLYPYSTGMGFATGLLVCALRRFGPSQINETYQSFNLLNYTRAVELRENRTRQFSQANFFCKMQFLSTDMFAILFFTNKSGSFIQSFLLANRLV